MTTELDPTPYYIVETDAYYSRTQVLADPTETMWNLAEFKPREGFAQNEEAYPWKQR